MCSLHSGPQGGAKIKMRVYQTLFGRTLLLETGTKQELLTSMSICQRCVHIYGLYIYCEAEFTGSLFSGTDRCGQTCSSLRRAQVPTRLALNLTLKLFTTQENVFYVFVELLNGMLANSSVLVLTKYLPKAKVRKEKSLLSGNEEGSEDEEVEEPCHD